MSEQPEEQVEEEVPEEAPAAPANQQQKYDGGPVPRRPREEPSED